MVSGKTCGLGLPLAICQTYLDGDFFPSSEFPSFAWNCCCWARVNVMWGFPCALGTKWRWNVYFGSSLLLWFSSFSLYSLPFYILNLLLFSISYHHNYYGHMSFFIQDLFFLLHFYFASLQIYLHLFWLKRREPNSVCCIVGYLSRKWDTKSSKPCLF